jgi:hypothetical protein
MHGDGLGLEEVFGNNGWNGIEWNGMDGKCVLYANSEQSPKGGFSLLQSVKAVELNSSHQQLQCCISALCIIFSGAETHTFARVWIGHILRQSKKCP